MKKKQIYNNKLRELRESRNLSLTEAAKLMDISKVHLSNIENGHERVSAKLISTIKEVYKPSPEEWLRYFASFTQLADITSNGSVIEGEEIDTENTASDEKVLTLSTGKEVQINFIWIPKKKTKKQHKLLL